LGIFTVAVLSSSEEKTVAPLGVIYLLGDTILELISPV
jgi:hypothetical protein